MAAIALTIADALDTKIKRADIGWGSTAAWKDWIKAETKRFILNNQLRLIDTNNAAVLDAARAVALNEDAAIV